MSYDAVVLIPILLAASLAATLALATPGHLRLVLALVGVAGSVTGLIFGLDATAGIATAHRSGWDAEIARGFALWHRQEQAEAYLAWSALPILPSAVALGLWARRRGRRMRRIVLAGGLGLPLVLALVLGARWAAPYTTSTWPVEDVRWQWGYVAACLDRECEPFDVRIACDHLEGLTSSQPDALARHVRPARMEEARALCAEPVRPEAR